MFMFPLTDGGDDDDDDEFVLHLSAGPRPRPYTVLKLT